MALSLGKNVNRALAFFLELCMLASLLYWGFQIGQGLIAKIALALGASIVVIVLWAIWGAPRSARRLKGAWQFVFRAVIFCLTALALWSAAQPILAIIFALLVALTLTLTALWGE
jgi:Protein of unknown function (DUF2568)